jgi:acyl-CoA thioesterase
VHGFETDIALDAAGDGEWAGEIQPGWDTPRGPLGGYVMAIVLRGLELAVDDPERQPRSATMHFLRVPASGPVTVQAAVEREGRSLSTVSGRLEQDGNLLGLALGAFSKPWPGNVYDEASIPEVDPAEPRQRAEPRFERDRPPAFVERLSMQRRFGDQPFSGSEHGEVGGWLGLLERRPVDALTVAICADAWFPAPWPRLAELHPAPTIELTIHFRAPLPREDSLLLGQFRNRLVRDGFFDEDGELWAPDGTLVAQSRQLGLLLEPRTP